MDLLTQHAESNGAHAAVIVDASGGGHPSATSYAELEADANRLGRVLLSLGGVRGDRVVWCGPNSLRSSPRSTPPARSASRRSRCRTGSTPSRDAVRDRQLRRHVGDRRRRAGSAASRRCATSCPRCARCLVFGGAAPGRLRPLERRGRAGGLALPEVPDDPTRAPPAPR